MADKYQKLKHVKFYDCGGTSYSIGVVKNSDYNKYYVSLTRNATYIDKAGNSKLGDQSLYLTLLSIPQLFKNLKPELRFAEKYDAEDKSAHIWISLITLFKNAMYNEGLLCSIENKKAEALAAFKEEEKAARLPAEEGEQQQQKETEQWSLRTRQMESLKTSSLSKCAQPS